MKKYRFTTLCLAVAATFAHAGNVMAQSDDGVLLAYENSQKDSITTADDEIFAALQALDEVGAIIKAEHQEGKSQSNTQNDKVDVDALLAAVNQPAEPMKSFRVDDPIPDMSEQAAPKHDIQTAPAKSESIAAAPKHDIQTAPAKVESLAAAPKHDIQTAPAKVESLAAAPKHDIQTAPAKVESLAAAPKHDIQTAPAKVESLAAAPRHDIQTAPAKVQP
ncbi:MAG: hypothetical protein J6S69_05675, partial [Proteobacteria bacterium]|nr:hypothetical protein [Pseudomonadota bacterium]